MATRLEKPLVVIAGPTASGKTALAIKLAKKFGGEIICADSRTVYRGMDIGTAKPTQEEQSTVPHWGVDLVEPGQRFTAADFKAYADKKIIEIRSRGAIPFLVGGTGLYIDAVVFNYTFAGDMDEDLRLKLSRYSTSELIDYCNNNNIKLPENYNNKRYLIRAIEKNNISDMSSERILDNSIVVGITTDKQELRTRIELRTEQIIRSGVVKEATGLAAKYGWGSEAMTGNIYPIAHRYTRGEIGEAEFVALASRADWQLAKRQLTWLRRNPYLIWGNLNTAEHYLADRLANR